MRSLPLFGSAFALTIQYLELAINPNYSGIPISNSETNLTQYADDTTIFLRIRLISVLWLCGLSTVLSIIHIKPLMIFINAVSLQVLFRSRGSKFGQQLFRRL